MKTILAFSGSLSQRSINHELVTFTASKLGNVEAKIIRLSDFEVENYRQESEKESGIPEKILMLKRLIDDADGVLISTPEYNSSLPAGLKNTIDWLSRIENEFLKDKPTFLMATSPGRRGGQSALEHLSMILKFRGANISGTFSLPQFKDNLVDGKMHPDQESSLIQNLKAFEQAVQGF